jgi:hypothetical protein
VILPRVPTSSPVPPEVGAELERVAQRWRQLPLDRALSYAGRVRALVQSLADEVAMTTGLPVSEVPDCGPATLMDQLRVMVYDVLQHDPELNKPELNRPEPNNSELNRPELNRPVQNRPGLNKPEPSARARWLVQEIADLRRALH